MARAEIEIKLTEVDRAKELFTAAAQRIEQLEAAISSVRARCEARAAKGYTYIRMADVLAVLDSTDPEEPTPGFGTVSAATMEMAARATSGGPMSANLSVRLDDDPDGTHPDVPAPGRSGIVSDGQYGHKIGEESVDGPPFPTDFGSGQVRRAERRPTRGHLPRGPQGTDPTNAPAEPLYLGVIRESDSALPEHRGVHIQYDDNGVNGWGTFGQMNETVVPAQRSAEGAPINEGDPK